MSIHARIVEKIRTGGPMNVAQFMAMAIEHYYDSHEPFGEAGDFITAPEISQIFGEMVGVWCVIQWEKMGRPNTLRLVELGPGRGTLMADLLRATLHVEKFREALSIHLIERSDRLKQQQKAMLEKAHPRLHWHHDLNGVPAGTMLLVANEFFDALPIRQFVKRADGFHERMVALDANGALTFTTSGAVTDVKHLGGDAGDTAEYSEVSETIMRTLATRIAADGGAALIIDYGYTHGHGDTLQALKEHQYAPVLQTPGDADITALVDFAALTRAAESAKVNASVITQAEFLKNMGADVRLERLCALATSAQQKTLILGLERLMAPEQMGTLFKVMEITRA